MEQTRDVFSLIREKYDTFSKSHRRLADYIMNNPADAAFQSINEFGRATGISPATITRFVYKLEFQGYSEFQRSMYEHQRQRIPFRQLKTLLRSESAGEAEDTISDSIQQNIHLLELLDTPEIRASFQRALDTLRAARTIYITGHRSSYATAYYLAFMLQQMLPNVRLLDTTSSNLPAALCDVSPEDSLIVVSYSRYTSASYAIVSHFHRIGCGIVALTDSLTSPIALKATEVLIAPNGENFSPVGAITLCNGFITSLGRFDAKRTLERMERQDEIALANNIYL